MSNRQIAKEIGRGECVVRNFLKDRENHGRNQVIGRPTVLTRNEHPRREPRRRPSRRVRGAPSTRRGAAAA